jgi:4-amino-4-deoxy-L-arabinose transferase-like glycosyltransferase
MAAAVWPTYFDTGDVWQYVVTADQQLFADPLHPAGYPAFLRILRPLSSSVAFPVLVQHLLGMGAAVLLHDAGRRLGLSPWLRLVAPATVLLSIDQVSTEHRLMTDALFGVLLLAGAWLLLVHWTGDRRNRLTLVGAGVALAAATYIRLVAGPVIGVALVAAAAQRSTTVRSRLGAVGAVAAGAVLVVVPYETALHATEGRLRPSSTSGWSAYVRVAPLADCSKFEPPEGTSHLCERSDPATRPGPDYYAWRGGPARASYGDFTRGNTELAAFATAVVRAQPLDYAAEVGRDLVRYVLPLDVGREVAGGLPMAGVDSVGSPAVESLVEDGIESYYDPTHPARRPQLVDVLAALQPVLRAGTPFLLVPMLLAGWLLVRRRSLPGAVAFLLGFVLVVVGTSAATVGYVWRYALPVLPLASLAGAAAFEALRVPGSGPGRGGGQPGGSASASHAPTAAGSAPADTSASAASTATPAGDSRRRRMSIRSTSRQKAVTA